MRSFQRADGLQRKLEACGAVFLYFRAFRLRGEVVRGFGRLRFIRSGSFFRPVSRFHSSKVSFEISPLTSSSANLRRCAWLLKGISAFPVRHTVRAASPA